jgi:hypothetical protein
VATDASWLSASQTEADWQRVAVPSFGWLPAIELGVMDMAPWRRQAEEIPGQAIYPDYESVATILAQSGGVADFESSPRLRYTHRRDGNADIYFVSNPENRSVDASATFRVAGWWPELWDPVTGLQRPLPAFAEQNGRTTVPLRFAPHESFFVVFQERLGGARGGGGNFPSFSQAAGVVGPWVVHFQPGRGAPAQVATDFLFDWSKHPDAGVRHFSGIGTYTTEFEWVPPVGAQPGGVRTYLDLGRVAVMAGVSLNGRDQGVVWTAPYHVDVTDALQVGRNRLEIRVANLWPNRLIGDASLPEDKRVAWTTWNPFSADAPLLESGLLGPVTLQRARFEP